MEEGREREKVRSALHNQIPRQCTRMQSAQNPSPLRGHSGRSESRDLGRESTRGLRKMRLPFHELLRSSPGVADPRSYEGFFTVAAGAAVGPPHRRAGLPSRNSGNKPETHPPVPRARARKSSRRWGDSAGVTLGARGGAALPRARNQNGARVH